MEELGADGGAVAPGSTSTTTRTVAPSAPALPLFQGIHRLKLEASGRVTLPAAFKGSFASLAHIRPHRDQKLMLWTPQAFAHVVAATKADTSGMLGPRRVIRLHMATTDVSVDKQGRFVVPAELQARVGLGEQIVLAGARETVEIWSAEAFAAEEATLDENDLFFDGYEGA